MIKVLYRTLIILLVAGLIAGGRYALVNSGAVASLLPAGGRGFDRQGQAAFQLPSIGQSTVGQGTFSTSFQPRGDFGGDGDFHGGIGVQAALMDMAKNTSIVAVFTLVIVLAQRAFSLMFRRRTAQTLKV